MAGRRLSRYKDQRTALMRSLVGALVRHERLVTTLAKAKETRIAVEKLITHGKEHSLHHRRLALSEYPSVEVVHKVFDELATRYASRAGGYTRIVKLGPRKGDAAPMAVIELV
ncbi:MAG: 50S ribosomal protein L17 [SAR202 cluster bacterium]|nr:50S ribosomal protein L17 [SAR202 cluster bacterium]